jgi:hypothetical protein
MAIKLSAAYSKKVGLPGYSSHSFSVSIETELQNLDNVREESARLYESLQEPVDQQIQKTGFVPPDGYGMKVDRNGRCMRRATMVGCRAWKSGQKTKLVKRSHQALDSNRCPA